MTVSVRLLQAVLFGVGLAFPYAVIAQTAPTATEEFKRIKCKQMADEKAESMTERLMTDAKGASVGLKPADVALMNEQIELRMANVITSSHASNYDPKGNRCYIEIVKQWRDGRDFESEQYLSRALPTTISALIMPTRTWTRKCDVANRWSR
jgi:hypothetical protein